MPVSFALAQVTVPKGTDRHLGGNIATVGHDRERTAPSSAPRRGAEEKVTLDTRL
jgi:hypothetical protein